MKIEKSSQCLGLLLLRMTTDMNSYSYIGMTLIFCHDFH